MDGVRVGSGVAFMDRRNFFRLMAGLGVGVAATRVVKQLAFRQTWAGPRAAFVRPMMGTSVSILVTGLDSSSARGAAEDAFAEMARLEGLLSRYRVDSPLAKLNRQGYLQEASPELLHVLERARFFSDVSEGGFDITVQPLVDLMAKSFAARGRAPSLSEMTNARRLVNYQRVQVEGPTVQLQPGTGITLDGIAKGHIVDKALEVLKKHGVEHGLVEAGGDIGTVGSKHHGEGWRIGVRDPFGGLEPIRVLEVSGRAVATSGDYEIFFDSDKSFYHIVDPLTGFSPRELHSVTVVAGRALDADALATAVMVLGVRRGVGLVESFGDAACLLVSRDGRIVESAGMKGLVG